MHPNPIFRSDDTARSLAFARARGFGTLMINGDAGPLVAHVPFVISDAGDALDLHLVRSNPVARAPGGPAAMAVSGADAYVSPDWYGVEHQVPTWNYVAVHLRGRLEARPAEELRGHIAALSDHFEAMLAPKPVWKLDKMPDDALARMMRMIVPMRLHIEEIDATWKLGQNKSASARVGAADAMNGGTPGLETAALAALMRALDDTE